MTDQANTDDWPTFSDELTRKGMQTLQVWLDRHDRGEAKLRDIYVVTSVLWDVMAGLAHKDELRAIEAAHQEIIDSVRKKHNPRV